MNIGTVESGTAPNTVPAYTKTQIDCRFTSLEQSERLNQFISTLYDTVTEEGVKISVPDDITPLFWRHNETGLAFCHAVAQIKERLSIQATEWESTVGSSDSNFFAALSAIVIDGVKSNGGK
ncbi:MAG: peptidase dimerization domain-containing protein [Pasteurella oralis]|uniref:peptidase dimerization domain-containing protein n=1 Tax=Pasteurella oralis TaxID=1071947 RepID=UPI00270079E3|nr:peptidase dimerization domain-containing protein [Pasteurella oralis]